MGGMIEMTDKVFGRLTVIGFSHRSESKRIFWKCQCKCGNTANVNGANLRNGSTKSCGCLSADIKRDFIVKLRKTHGMTKTRTYKTWNGIIQRCLNSKNSSYHHYGGRGITVCNRWLKFENFYVDMGDRPDDMSIDRIDNDGNYEPDNCRWATQKEQTRNARSNRLILYNGETKTMVEWSETLGLSYATITNRVYKGLSVDEILMK